MICIMGQLSVDRFNDRMRFIKLIFHLQSKTVNNQGIFL